MTTTLRTSSLRRRVTVLVVVVLFLLLALVASIACRRILPTGDLLVGGRLLPTPDGARDLWDQFTAAWHPVSVGSDVPAA